MLRFRRPIVFAAAVSAAALVAGGCGGAGGSPPGASVTSSTPVATAPTANQLLAFSQCMRSNGVSSFPDPQRFVGGNVKLTIHQLGTGSPHLQSALNACTHLLPQRGSSPDTPQQTTKQLADELSFARCMRSHGVTHFPDPKAQGGLTVEMVQAEGIDVR